MKKTASKKVLRISQKSRQPVRNRTTMRFNLSANLSANLSETRPKPVRNSVFPLNPQKRPAVGGAYGIP